jgi:uncharacterized membrane protein (UPF0182 family)
MLLQALISLFPTFLWFDNLNFSSVFWIGLRAKVLTGLIFGIAFFLIVYLNVLFARSLGREGRKQRRVTLPEIEFKRIMRQLFGGEEGEEGGEGYIDVTPKPGDERRGNMFWALGVLVISFFVGLGAISQWDVILKALNATSFGIKDPIFNMDVGFYVFNLPLQKFLQGFLFSAFLFSLLGSIFIYFFDGIINLFRGGFHLGKGAKPHVLLLVAILAIIFSWGLWLGELEILYSARGVVFGAGYTDVKAQLLAYNLQIYTLVILAALSIFSIFRKDLRLPVYGLIFYFAVAIVMGGIYPAIVQNFRVSPNEITLETPYILNGIKYTRLAYGLENVEEKEFSADLTLNRRDIQRNLKTIDNIRLWDNRPLLKTYRQLQGIRLYYDFLDVDVDRYRINGDYKQIMLSPRELDVTKLPEKAQTWVNQHLKFTHGYGACLSPVSRQTREGLPHLIVKDIPPTTTTNLEINRPEIYYGEKTDNYVIVNTQEKEFDYPKGDKNIYATYAGKGGVQISSFWRRLAFAIKFSDLQVLLTRYITPQSRIMFNRNIHSRVATIAPFLRYDRDPYLIISEGRLLWIQDAYTITDLYPYSDPTGSGFNKFNYIRNSAKVVVDAYNGDVSFYIVDEKDPIIQTYKKIYPKLFKSFAQMPENIKEHLRYPYDLFMIQSKKYATFHMQDAEVFYNREDLWNVPREIYISSEQPMDAYYVIMKLPEEKKEEFLLMLPFTPNNKDNMIAWLAGRSDMPNYGKLIVYKFSKEKLVYGPMQIEARIDQQTEISQQFTLWGQMGSRVIRGNLLAIPIENSVIYVEPVFLEAASGELPELKRVIAAYGRNVAMAETLEDALSAVISVRLPTTRVKREAPKELSTRELARRALSLFNQAQSSLRSGNFGNFGEKLNELGKILQNLSK